MSAPIPIGSDSAQIRAEGPVLSAEQYAVRNKGGAQILFWTTREQAERAIAVGAVRTVGNGTVKYLEVDRTCRAAISDSVTIVGIGAQARKASKQGSRDQNVLGRTYPNARGYGHRWERPDGSFPNHPWQKQPH